MAISLDTAYVDTQKWLVDNNFTQQETNLLIRLTEKIITGMYPTHQMII